MKTKLFFASAIIIFLFINFKSFGQVKVISNLNVGIGIDNPLEKLHVNGAIRGNQPAGALQITTTQGYLTLGAQNTSCAHYMTGTAYHFFNKGLISGDGKFLGYNNTNLNLYTCTGWSYSPRLTISYSTGNVGIGRSPSSTYKLDVGGSIAINGTLVLSSDTSLKEDVKPIIKSFDKIAQLNPISYQFKKPQIVPTDTSISDSIYHSVNSDEFYNQTHFGFSAQDLQKVFPELVMKDDNGVLAVDYIGLIPLLVTALKEQNAVLEEKIIELEKKVNEISKIQDK